MFGKFFDVLLPNLSFPTQMRPAFVILLCLTLDDFTRQGEITTHFTDMCIPHFSRFRTAFDGRRSTQAWLQNLAPFQVFINTSVIQDIEDKTLTIYINFGKFKLEKVPNFVTRPASNVVRKRELKMRNAHISEMRSNAG
jgi:hypothetical protein